MKKPTILMALALIFVQGTIQGQTNSSYRIPHLQVPLNLPAHDACVNLNNLKLSLLLDDHSNDSVQNQDKKYRDTLSQRKLKLISKINLQIMVQKERNVLQKVAQQ